jgi:hypothetical protein
VPHKDEQTRPDGPRLTAEEVGARVGAILSDAEREAREIIASARRDGIDASLPALQSQGGATLDDLSHVLEGLRERFDAFELATAAQIEDLGRQLHDALAGAELAPGPSHALEPPVGRVSGPPREESSQFAAARVRAIDLALAGYSRDAIANELSTSMARPEVEALLDDVLVP